jgi:N-acetylmuramoyl-L-alanine amidase
MRKAKQKNASPNMSSKQLWSFLQYKRIILLVLIFLVPSFSAQGWNPGSAPPPSKLTRVVIDAGHGGKDPGSVGKHIMEREIALAVALKLGNYIKSNYPEVEVIFTRKEDVFVELSERADIANRNDADLFISIHANSNKNKEAYGTETYAMGLKTDDKNFEVAKKENSVIAYEDDYTTRYEGFDPNSPESYIIFSLMQNKYLEQSLTFASHIQDELRDRAKRTDRGVKQAGFLVLWKSAMPSVLVETGFISNPDEEKFLISEEGQDIIASGIFRAFCTYKEEIEQRSSFTHETKKPAETPKNSEPIADSALCFKVQLTSSSKPIESGSSYFEKIRSAYPDSSIGEFQFGGMFKYSLGTFNDYKTASAFAKEVRKKWPDAFVIAVRNRNIIPLSEALNKPAGHN